MKLVLAFAILVLLTSDYFGQNTTLPEILRPDAFAESEAKRLDAEVFKILPRGTYENPAGTYKDEENPLGIRQGGSYYSFTKGSHSYNKIPQIGLEQGNIQVGFYGGNYGLMADLGSISLSDVSDQLPVTMFLLGYVPPKYYKNIYEEAGRAHKIEANGQVFSRRLPAFERHTYLLRAISFDEADKLVALQVISKEKDGSVTIVWKSIKDFDVPRMMRQTEDELRAKIVEIMNKPEYSTVEFIIKDDVVTLRGALGNYQISQLMYAVNGARPGKLVNEITVK